MIIMIIIIGKRTPVEPQPSLEGFARLGYSSELDHPVHFGVRDNKFFTEQGYQPCV
jgi:hypothetical protein